MGDKLLAARFRASMEGLERGDIVYRIVGNGQKKASVVLKTEREGGRKLCTVSPFSPLLVCSVYPRRVFYDALYGWLADEKGGVFLTSEEWGGTEKDEASKMLNAISDPFDKHATPQQEVEAVARIFARRNSSFFEDAEELLNLIFGKQAWGERECTLLAAALAFAHRLGR